MRLLSASRARGRLEGGGLSVPCAVGRSGVTRLKREGDGGSPAGSLRILRGFYRPDRFGARPPSAVPLRPLRRDDAWCDSSGDPNYNRPVRLPYGPTNEGMWRDDDLYDLVLVLDWNIRPRARGCGSAIFFHLARPGYAPTAGCVAVSRADMLKLLARLAPGAAIRLG